MVNIMGTQRVTAGIKILPELKTKMLEQAQREDKTLSKLGEVLLAWAFEQLEVAENTLALKDWKAVPKRDSELLKIAATKRGARAS